MRLPRIFGVIRRRLLVNWRVDPAAIQALLPPPFRPKLVGDAAIAGICLIRLEQIRPRFIPAALGVASENAAHRIAVVWDDADGTPREGVYIPRRDSSSLLNHWAGGRLFPGEHHRARFHVVDKAGTIELAMRSRDGAVAIEVHGHAVSAMPATSCFASVAQASEFFEAGGLGYSATARADKLDGVSLVTDGWKVAPLAITRATSTFFDDTTRFPTGTARFDSALIMRDVAHEWRSAPSLALAA